MTSLLGPVADAEGHRRQRRSIRLLTALDERHPDLPALCWSVTPWSLVGHCDAPGMDGRRAAYEAWVGALGLDRWADRRTEGTLRLRAVSVDFEGSGVAVSVEADIWEDELADADG